MPTELKMVWALFTVYMLAAIAIGPFLLAYFGRPLLGVALPAGYLLLIVLLTPDEPPNYDMQGFGTKLLILGTLIAATAWIGGVVGGLIRSRRRGS